MYITSKYLGENEKKKYFFYLLYEDYVQTQLNYVKELEKYIERFGRNLQDNGGVIKPFIEDIEQTKEDILSKNWNEDEKRIFTKTPGMLMIDIEFDKFNPRKNQWIYFNFEQQGNIEENILKVDKLLKGICNIINSESKDAFKEIKKLRNSITLQKKKNIIELKPRNLWIQYRLKRVNRNIKRVNKKSKSWK